MPLFLGNGADAGPAIGQKSSKRRRLEVSAASLQAGSTIVPKEGGAAGGAIPSNRPAATEHGAGGTSAQTTVEIGNRVEVVYDAELYTATVLAVDQASGNCSVRYDVDGTIEEDLSVQEGSIRLLPDQQPCGMNGDGASAALSPTAVTKGAITSPLVAAAAKVKKAKKVKKVKSIPRLESTAVQGFAVQWPNVKLWFKYICERHRVYHKWLSRAPHPWTADAIITKGQRPGDLLLNLLIFRAYLNSGEAMDILGLQSCANFTESAFLAKLDAIQEARGKVSNAAYNVGSFGAYRAVASGKGCKPRRAARMFATMAAFGLDAKLKRLLAQGDSAATFDAICALPGIGQFIGYQICIDLGYWSQEVYDESKHVFLGPGAVLGLKWLFGAADTHTPMEQIHFLERIQHTVFKEIGEVPEMLFAPEFPVGCRKLNLMALENSLCEGNKYMRTHYGTGSFKQSYKAGSVGASDQYLRNHAVLNSELDKGRGGDGSGNSGTSDSGDGAGAGGAPVGGGGGSSSLPAASAAATAIKVET